MPEICCPYCNGRNILKIVYCYRGVNKRKQNDFDYSDYLKEGTILMKRTNFEKYDFDGECKKLCVKIPIYGNKTFLEVDKFNLFFIIKYYHNLINFQISN